MHSSCLPCWAARCCTGEHGKCEGNSKVADWPGVQMELLPHLLKVMDVNIMTGSEGQRKLTLGNATILAYCLRWAEFRVSETPLPL